MGIRPKLFLVFFTCGIVPMLVFAVANYVSGVRAVEDLLGREVERDTRAVANNIETALRDREAALTALARSRVMREYVGGSQTSPVALYGPHDDLILLDLHAAVEALLADNRNGYAALACLNTEGKPLFRAEVGGSGGGEANGTTVRYQTKDFLPSNVAADERVWTTAEQTPLRSAPTHESFGTNLRYTVPVFTAEASPSAPRGALIVDLKLNALCKDAISNFAGVQTAPRLFVVLDKGGRIVCHTNEALLYQPVTSAMPPSFKPVAEAMLSGESGQKYFDSPDGDRWLVSYQPIKALDLFLGVAGNDTAVLHGLRREGWLSIILSALAGLLTAVLLMLMARRMERSIERVTEGAVAIAGGRLDQRIEVQSSDETRLLAETFNQMTDRLREQIARESETKQFQSFMRLSAMLTHDLKNAITALSLVVSNMEQQFDREEFRAEAMESLKESTDKLRSLVAKLSGPVESLSGEYQRPRPTDLLPHFKRVLNHTAEAQSVHQVETHLPAALVATVDVERVERVFENLVLNALEAMGTKSGTLTVEGGPEGEAEIFFSVTDTGPGISEEFQRTRLFRAFATTKRKGVGLGLYTCREVVRAHGGSIDVKSAKGAGATFRVVLPSGRFTGGE